MSQHYFFFLSLNHLLASGNRLRKRSLIPVTAIGTSNGTMGIALVSLLHILPGRAQVTPCRDERTLLQLATLASMLHILPGRAQVTPCRDERTLLQLTTLPSMSHILPGRAQVTPCRDKRTLLQLDA